MSWGEEGHAERYRGRVFAERARLSGELADLAGRQAAVLADLVRFNLDTDFGRRHGLGSVRTLKDLQAAVPVQDYAAHEPYIERMAAGSGACSPPTGRSSTSPAAGAPERTRRSRSPCGS